MGWLKGIACLSLAALVVGTPVAAQSGVPVTPRVVRTEERIEELRAALAAAEAELVARRKIAEARALLPTEVVRQEARVEELAAALAEAEWHVEKGRLLTALQQPVDVSFRDLTLCEAADCLAEAADLELRVDEQGEATDPERRFSLSARGIPAYAVLVSLAAQSGRMIAAEDGELVLRRWPELAMNGTRRVFTSRFAPWSEEWGDAVEAFALPPGSPFSEPPGKDDNGKESRTAPPPAAITPLPQSPISPLQSPPVPPGSVTLSVAGERLVVVSEAGVGSKGEAGAWLTVYQLDLKTKQLRRVSRTFHPPAGAAPLAPGRATAAPKPRTTRR